MQRSTMRAVITILLGTLGLLFAASAHAQYSDNFQTNIISGVISNWSGDYNIGYPNFADALLIQSGGVLSDSSGSMGNGGGRAGQGDNVAVVSGSGSVWNNSGSLNVGNGTDNNQLLVTNGGAVYSVGGSIGGGYISESNTVLVTGTGSVWSNAAGLSMSGLYPDGNSLIIAVGGAVYNGSVDVGGYQGGYGNIILVTGSGSMWSTGSLSLGGESQNTMTISNGGVVNSSSSSMGGEPGQLVLVAGKGSVWNSGGLSIESIYRSSLIISDGGAVYSSGVLLRNDYGSLVLVTGSGSVWDIQSSLDVAGLSSSVTASNGGAVIAGDVYSDAGNYITISGGALFVTNGLGSGSLVVSGTLMFNSGTLATRATTINNGSVFTVGDGVNQATFIMEPGGSGFHSFANGLTISSNAVLKGVGTIIGDTVVNPGGTLSPGDAPGSITFSNSLTLAPGSTFAVELDGAGEGQYSRLVGFDTLSVSNSILSVALGYTPSAGDTFTIISNLSATAVLGTFVDPDGTALTEGAEFVVDGTTFQIDYTANADGQDVVLTALIPEPSSLLLASLAALLLCPLLKRRRA